MKSWRTTLSGAISSGAALVMALSGAGVSLAHWMTVTASFVLVGGFAALGIAGKDAVVHSTAQEVQASTIDSRNGK